MLLVMEPVGQREARPVLDGKVLYDRMVAFGESLKARGVLKAYDSLGSTAKGVRVVVRDGKRSLIDGPFAEAKEFTTNGAWWDRQRGQKFLDHFSQQGPTSRTSIVANSAAGHSLVMSERDLHPASTRDLCVSWQ
jgi:hypothetical protein